MGVKAYSGPGFPKRFLYPVIPEDKGNEDALGRFPLRKGQSIFLLRSLCCRRIYSGRRASRAKGDRHRAPWDFHQRERSKPGGRLFEGWFGQGRRCKKAYSEKGRLSSPSKGWRSLSACCRPDWRDGQGCRTRSLPPMPGDRRGLQGSRLPARSSNSRLPPEHRGCLRQAAL